MYILSTIFTMTTSRPSIEKFRDYPWVWVVVVLNVLAIANIPRAIYLNKPFYAFLSSSATIAAFTFLFGMTLFPNMIVSTVDPAYNLTWPGRRRRRRRCGSWPASRCWGCRSC